MVVLPHRALLVVSGLCGLLPAVDSAVCSITDGSALSTAYPCDCGNITCADGQQCTSASSSCKCAAASTFLTNYSALVKPQCSNFTKESSPFSPDCLPKDMLNYTFLSGPNRGKEPFVYNTWVFAEACGLQMTAWRALNQLPRRKVLYKAAESILMNWGVYAGGTIVASVFMNVFYIAPRRKRCCGLFNEADDPRDQIGGCTYQKLNGAMYMLLMFPIAAMTVAACMYQFVRQLMRYHEEINTLMAAACYEVQGSSTSYVLDAIPNLSCKDILRLDWVCNDDMVKILMLAIFCVLDTLFAFALWGITCSVTILACMRVYCVCCGCRVLHAAMNTPLCCCGKAFNAGMCMCWSLCHPTAFCCIVGFLMPFGLGLYWMGGLFATLAAFGVLIAIVVCLIGGLEMCCRSVIEILSCGRCFALDIPKSWYFRALIPMPGNLAGSADASSERRRIKEQLFDDMSGGGEGGRFDPNMDAGDEGFEAEIMGTPCPHVMMTTAPYPILMIVIPIGLLVFVIMGCFMWQDYIAFILAWKNADMTWYTSDSRMGPGWKMWQFWWQMFTELINGLTDAWTALFKDEWEFVYATATFNKTYYDGVTGFLEHGVNPANLFRADFPRFRQGVLFWRFVLAAVFTMIRTTALINLPRSAIHPDDRYYESGDPYDETEALDMDPYDPYSGY